MTRKPAKPKSRKGSKPTLVKRVADLEVWANVLEDARRESHENIASDFREVKRRLDALETRKHLRDASHDEPVSNAGEAVGQHFRILADAPREILLKEEWMNTFLGPRRTRWWQFWRRR